MRRNIAVIGSGISGLATAWLLREHHRVTLYERDARLGGHSHTVMIPASGFGSGFVNGGGCGPAGGSADGDAGIPVDTGFMVFNRRTYPNLVALFEHLSVTAQPSPMSFSVSADDGRVEWAGTSLNTLFAQRGNLLRPRFLGMVRDILRFNRIGLAAATAEIPPQGTVREWLDAHGFGAYFRDHYLLPMAAAIWSAPPRRMLDYPARGLLSFFANHGLLQLADRPQWYTPGGGSRVYVARLAADLRAHGHVLRDAPVERVVRAPEGGVRVHCRGGRADHFDEVVLATHADQALDLLAAPTVHERLALERIRYQDNRVYLHADRALMPRRERVWSAWNYRRDGHADDASVSVTYWMSTLQSLPRPDVFVSLNPLRTPRDEAVFAELRYAHPLLDARAVEGQRMVAGIQGVDRIWFAGAWLGHGFHEDGLRAALAVANGLGVAAPWQTALPETRPMPVAGGLERAA